MEGGSNDNVKTSNRWPWLSTNCCSMAATKYKPHSMACATMSESQCAIAITRKTQQCAYKRSGACSVTRTMTKSTFRKTYAVAKQKYKKRTNLKTKSGISYTTQTQSAFDNETRQKPAEHILYQANSHDQSNKCCRKSGLPYSKIWKHFCATKPGLTYTHIKKTKSGTPYQKPRYTTKRSSNMQRKRTVAKNRKM